MKNRFRVLQKDEAVAAGYYEIGKWEDDWGGLLYDFKTDPPMLIASDRSEPEDVSFYRDLAWVPKLLNELEEGKDE